MGKEIKIIYDRNQFNNLITCRGVVMRKFILLTILSVCILRLGSKFPHDFRLIYFPEVGVTCLWFVGVESSAIECWGFQEAPEGIRKMIQIGKGWKCKK